MVGDSRGEAGFLTCVSLFHSVSEEHLKLIQDYLRVHITSDFEMVQMGSSSLPQLKKLLTVLCKGLFR